MMLAGIRHGLPTVYAHNDMSVGQILPPLIIQAPEVRQVIEALDRMLAWVEGAIGARKR